MQSNDTPQIVPGTYVPRKFIGPGHPRHWPHLSSRRKRWGRRWMWVQELAHDAVDLFFIGAHTVLDRVQRPRPARPATDPIL